METTNNAVDAAPAAVAAAPSSDTAAASPTHAASSASEAVAASAPAASASGVAPSSRRSHSRSNSRSQSRSPSRSRSRSGSRSRSRSRSRSVSRGRAQAPSSSAAAASAAAPAAGDSSVALVVRALTRNVQEGHLEEIFKHFGTVTKVDLPTDPKVRRRRGKRSRGWWPALIWSQCPVPSHTLAHAFILLHLLLCDLYLSGEAAARLCARVHGERGRCRSGCGGAGSGPD